MTTMQVKIKVYSPVTFKMSKFLTQKYRRATVSMYSTYKHYGSNLYMTEDFKAFCT